MFAISIHILGVGALEDLVATLNDVMQVHTGLIDTFHSIPHLISWLVASIERWEIFSLLDVSLSLTTCWSRSSVGSVLSLVQDQASANFRCCQTLLRISVLPTVA